MTHPIARENSDPCVFIRRRRFFEGEERGGRGREDGDATARASAQEEFSDHDPR